LSPAPIETEIELSPVDQGIIFETSKYGYGKSVLNPASGSHGTDTTTRTSSSRSRWPTTGSTPRWDAQFQHEAVGGVIYRVNNAEIHYRSRLIELKYVGENSECRRTEEFA
jgi:hypothetical protein